MNNQNYHKQKVHFTGRLCPELLSNVLKRIVIERGNKIRVLDVGCGDGAVIAAINNHDLMSQVDITGVDNSKIRINNARNILNTKIVYGDALNLPLKSLSYDLVYSLMVMEHLDDDCKFTEELYRVTKHNGSCVVSTVIKKKWAIYLYRKDGHFVCDPTHQKEYTSKDELVKIFKKAGFKKIKFEQRRITFSVLELILRFLISTHLMSPQTARTFFDHNFLLNRLRYKVNFPLLGYFQGWIQCEKL